MSVARILVTNDTEFAAIEPLPLDKIQQDYTIVGVRVNQILPRLFKSVLGMNTNTQQNLEQNTDED